MDQSKKISEVSKEINYLQQMGISKAVRELLLQELKAKKNAKNKQMNIALLKKKKSQWILLQLFSKHGLNVSILWYIYIYSDTYNTHVMQ